MKPHLQGRTEYKTAGSRKVDKLIHAGLWDLWLENEGVSLAGSQTMVLPAQRESPLEIIPLEGIPVESIPVEVVPLEGVPERDPVAMYPTGFITQVSIPQEVSP